MRLTESKVRRIVRESLTSHENMSRVVDVIHERILNQLERDPRIIDLVQQIVALPDNYEDYDQMESVREEFHNLAGRIEDTIRESNPTLKTLVDMVAKMEEKALSGSYLEGKVESVSRDDLEQMVCNSLSVRLIWRLSNGATDHVEEEQATTSPAETFNERFIISHRAQIMSVGSRSPLVNDDEDDEDGGG